MQINLSFWIESQGIAQDVHLNVKRIGREACKPAKKTVAWTGNYYSLHFIREGRGMLKIGEQETSLKEGMCFMLYKDRPYEYYPDKSYPWKYDWIDFDGENVELLLAECGLSVEKPYIAHPMDKYFIGELNRLYEIHDVRPNNHICVAAQFFKILSELIYRNKEARTQTNTATARFYRVRDSVIYAYMVPNQYWYGSELMVSPITEKRSAHSGYGSADLWLPAGSWFDFQTGLHYASRRGRNMKVYRTLENMSVFAKAGAIVPMEERVPHDNHLGRSAAMEVLVFPGKSNSFALYEDEGEGSGYTEGVCATTEMKLDWEQKCFEIKPALGDLTLLPQIRRWKICFRGFAKEIYWHTWVDGMQIDVLPQYDPEHNTTVLTLEAPITANIRIGFAGEQLIHNNGDVLMRCERVLQLSQLSIPEKTLIYKKLTDWDRPVHSKIFDITGYSEQSQAVVGVLRELLTLTEDEFLGNQI